MIQKTDEKQMEKVDWTKMWSKKYPVLETYQQVVAIDHYCAALGSLLAQLEQDYHYSRLDAMLVLKDILAHSWQKGQRG